MRKQEPEIALDLARWILAVVLIEHHLIRPKHNREHLSCVMNFERGTFFSFL